MIKIKRSELKKLSKDELASLYKKLTEVEEGQKIRSLERYLETAHDKQKLFHKCHKRIRLFFGGNRSGKTTGGTVEDLWTSLGTHPFRKIRTPNKGLVVVTDFENAAKNILEPKFMQWAPPGAIVKTERNQNGAWRKLHLSSGSTIDILSHDQDIKVFEGADWDWAHFDEPPPQRIFNAVWRGLTDRGGMAWITATPIVEPWTYREVKKAEMGDDLRWVIFVDMDDNVLNIGEGSLETGQKRIREFVDMLPEEERAARKSGQFLQLQGMIFKEWKPAHHLIEEFQWPSSWPIYETIDPHPQKPWAVAWIGVTPNNSKVLIRSGLFPGVIDDVAEQILYERAQIKVQHDQKLPLRDTIIDNYASVPMMGRSFSDPTARRKSVREELEAFIGPNAGGPRIRVAPKNVKSKIEFFKQWLRIKILDNREISEFYAFNIPENERFVFEVENYTWDTKRGGLMNGLKDTPRKVDDDILDAIMQVALTLPSDRETPEVVRSHLGNSYRV